MATLTLPSSVTFGAPGNPMLTVRAEDTQLNGQTEVAPIDARQNNTDFAPALAQDSVVNGSAIIPQTTNDSAIQGVDSAPDADANITGDIVDEVRYHLRYQPVFIRAVEKIVKAYRYEQADHATTRSDLRDAQDKLQSLRTKQMQLETELKRTKYQLNSVNENLATTILQLQNAVNDLEYNKTELERARKELEERRDELVQVKQQLANAQADLFDAEKKLQDAEQKLQKTTAELGDAQRDLTKTRGDLQNVTDENVSLNGENKRLKQELLDSQKREGDQVARIRRQAKIIEDLKEQLLDANTKSDHLAEENAILEREKDEALRDVVMLKQMNSELEARLAAQGHFIHYENRTRGDFYIDEVMWGGKVIDNEQVISDLLDYANSDESFVVSNELMKDDPWVGVPKTFTAVYAVKGRGPFLYISNREGSETQFFRPSESEEPPVGNPLDGQPIPVSDPNKSAQTGNPRNEPTIGVTDPVKQPQPVDVVQNPAQPPEDQANPGNPLPDATGGVVNNPIASTGPNNTTSAPTDPDTKPLDSNGPGHGEPGPTDSGYGDIDIVESSGPAIPRQQVQVTQTRQATGSYAQRQPYSTYQTRQAIPAARTQIAAA